MGENSIERGNPADIALESRGVMAMARNESRGPELEKPSWA
jgi:hypothetical protein